MIPFKKNCFVPFTLVCLVLFSFNSGKAISQTLNDVVSDQLINIAGNPCLILLGVDNPSQVLTGSLQTICTRPSGLGTTPPGSSSGGGAATPTSLPKVIIRRLKEDNKTESDGGASGDQVIELTQTMNLFLSGEYQNLDREVTTFEDGYDSDIWRMTAGADYQVQDFFTAGIAFDYRHQKGDFTGSGDFKLDSYGALVFASITPIEKLFIQISGGYAYQENERKRFASFSDTTGFSVSGFSNGDYNADEFSASIQSGYDFNIANFSIGPRLGLDWVRNNYDSYTETGNTGLELRFAKDHRTSLQSRLGLFSTAAFSTSFAVIVPQIGVDWIHEFKNNQRDIQFSFADDLRNKSFIFQNENPDRDFLEITAGTSLILPHGIQAFVNYRAIAGHSYFDGHSANFGLRIEF